MSDFETHPIGTAKRLAELEAALREISALSDPPFRIGEIARAALAGSLPETPPHLRGPIIQAYADTNGLPPETSDKSRPLTSDERAVVEQYLKDVTCPVCHCPKNMHRPGCSEANREGEV